MAVPSSNSACQSPWPRSGRLVRVVMKPVRHELDLDHRRREPARVGERPDRPARRSAGPPRCCRRRPPRPRDADGRRVDAAPTTVASPTRYRARSYRWVACSMTWPPPWSARPHQAGPGVASSQRATTSCGGRPGEPLADLGHDVERAEVVADADDEAGSRRSRRPAGPARRHRRRRAASRSGTGCRPRPAARRSPPPGAAARPRRRRRASALASIVSRSS